MTHTHVSTPRKLATAAFAGVMALSLMIPSQLALANYYVGEDEYSGEEDKSGEGSEGGTWSYTAEGQQMTLVDYVGERIQAFDQDLNVQLEGDNTVEGGISVRGGDLAVNGDSTVYGDDKPSLTLKSSEGGSNASLNASNYNYKTDKTNDNAGNLTISDVTVKGEAEGVYITASGGDLTIKDSKITRGDGNEGLEISGYGKYDSESRTNGAVTVTLKGSDIEATWVRSSGELVIDNTDLTVKKPASWEADNKDMIDFYKSEGYDYKWIEHAVSAIKISLKGEKNGTVVDSVDQDGKAYQYLTTGSDDKIELKASATPAYYGATKGMPATGDSTMPLVIGASITAAFAALVGAYSLRQRKYVGQHARK